MLRSVRIVYVMVPLLALVLGFLAAVEQSERGVPEASAALLATAGSSTESNGALAARLERAAAADGITVVRVVADPSAPDRRRTLLVTGAPGTLGSQWLADGYPEFARSITTTVEPMHVLDRHDTAGTYLIVGGGALVRVESEFRSAGFSVETERIGSILPVSWLEFGGGRSSLVSAVLLASAALCVVGTIGSPRRIAVRRLAGSGAVAVLSSEARALTSAVWTTMTLAVVAAAFLTVYNGFANPLVLARATSAALVVLLPPVVVVHLLCTLIAMRLPLPASIRGARPGGGLVFAAHAARIPAVVVVVLACFDLAGSAAIVRSGDAERELRAAGTATQLWVTPDPRPGAGTEQYWDRIGSMAARGLTDGTALLAATVEIGSGRGRETVPAVFVDGTYLDEQDVRAADGHRISADAQQMGVWTMPGNGLERDDLLRALRSWELRDAPARSVRHIGGGTLDGRSLYTYPGDTTVPAWVDAAVLVVVPDPANTFSRDQLGAWVSTGDLVFTSPATASRAISDASLDSEFSAIVQVGQDAAERARRAARDAWVDAEALLASIVVAMGVGAIAATAHRGRHGRRMLVRIAAGNAWATVNAASLVVEGLVLAAAAIVTANTWWAARPDGSGRISALDPVARSTDAAGLTAAIAVTVLSVAQLGMIAWSTSVTKRTRGRTG